MARQILLEGVIVAVQTMILIGLCATVGIPRSEPRAETHSERPLGLDLYRPEPADNPTKPETVRLGQQLFRERLLSRDGSIACADCHQPKLAFADGRSRAVGVQARRGPRNVPTLINRAWGESFFWDGRIETLEGQVLQPIQAESEMDLTLEEAVERLQQKRRYRRAFRKAFDEEPSSKNLGRALAAYLRTIQAGDSAYDRYLFGSREALSEQQLAGLEIFRGRGNCVSCHSGPTFSDEDFHNTGVAWREGEFHDLGRALVTGRDADRGKFKTPTLREVSRTAPYMHDGSFAILEDVVRFYSDGGRENPNRDAVLRRLDLTKQEQAELVAFLGALRGDIRDGK